MEFVPNEFVEHAIENLSVLKSPVKPFEELAGRHWTNYAKAFSSKVFLYKVEFHRGPRNRRNQWDVNIKKRTNKKWRRIELRELLRTPRKFIQFYIVTLEEGTEELPLSYRHSYEKVTRIIDLLALQKRCYQFVVDIDDVLVTEEVLAKIHKRTFFKELSVSAEEIPSGPLHPIFLNFVKDQRAFGLCKSYTLSGYWPNEIFTWAKDVLMTGSSVDISIASPVSDYSIYEELFQWWENLEKPNLSSSFSAGVTFDRKEMEKFMTFVKKTKYQTVIGCKHKKHPKACAFALLSNANRNEVNLQFRNSGHEKAKEWLAV